MEEKEVARAWARYGRKGSGVVAYALGPDDIAVEFVGGERYRYDAIAPGAVDVAQMKTRAGIGRGLSTFVSQHVKARYAEKLPPRRGTGRRAQRKR